MERTLPTLRKMLGHHYDVGVRQVPVRAVAQGHQKDCALAFGVRREERGYVVVEKRQTSGAQVLRVGRQIELAADDPGFKLHGAIAAIAIALQDEA